MNLITKKLLKWHATHGRHDLPWQKTNDAYRIWVSEIMLQQTQVATVIAYYQRFMASFPTVKELANASQDDVLHHWTGLGYYARARNLHKCAQIVTQEYNGQFPRSLEQMIALPGIGRSTAGAILAFAYQQHHPILDGNVKRVLSRFYEVEGWYGKREVETKLWQLAEANTPKKHVHTYTQAIMDFGATVCTRSKPSCYLCPLASNCQALGADRVAELPHGKPKVAKPTKYCFMILAHNQAGEVLLQKNPPSGIWGGLWCPPQLNSIEEALDESLGSTLDLNGLEITLGEHLPEFRHTFSHYHLMITPVMAKTTTNATKVTESSEQMWYKTAYKLQLGLAAPVKKLLERIA